MPDAKYLSERLYKILTQLEIIMEEVGALGDEMMDQYLIESGQVTPDNTDDFLTRKD